jgi:hypothetical protein
MCLVKADVGLGNVDNTSDANKPISTATQTALNGKANTNHTHTAASVSTSAIPGVTGDDVQEVLAELAGREVTGTSDTVSVVWDGTDYPAQPTEAPSGVVVRRFYGPVPYEGATWPGVLDTYEYADL